MINNKKLKEILLDYKRDLNGTWWDNEQFKWQALKCFQDNWDIEAEDFGEMMDRAFKNVGGLLTSAKYFPYSMIRGFVDIDKETVRGMFKELYDESIDVCERIKNFKFQSGELLKKTKAQNHFQAESAISVYLWLRYPEKYYIYKYSEEKSVAKVLESEVSFKAGDYENNMRNFLKLYDEITIVLKEDIEFLQIADRKIKR